MAFDSQGYFKIDPSQGNINPDDTHLVMGDGMAGVGTVLNAILFGAKNIIHISAPKNKIPFSTEGFRRSSLLENRNPEYIESALKSMLAVRELEKEFNLEGQILKATPYVIAGNIGHKMFQNAIMLRDYVEQRYNTHSFSTQGILREEGETQGFDSKEASDRLGIEIDKEDNALYEDRYSYMYDVDLLMKTINKKITQLVDENKINYQKIPGYIVYADVSGNEIHYLTPEGEQTSIKADKFFSCLGPVTEKLLVENSNLKPSIKKSLGDALWAQMSPVYYFEIGERDISKLIVSTVNPEDPRFFNSYVSLEPGPGGKPLLKVALYDKVMNRDVNDLFDKSLKQDILYGKKKVGGVDNLQMAFGIAKRFGIKNPKSSLRGDLSKIVPYADSITINAMIGEFAPDWHIFAGSNGRGVKNLLEMTKNLFRSFSAIEIIKNKEQNLSPFSTNPALMITSKLHSYVFENRDKINQSSVDPQPETSSGGEGLLEYLKEYGGEEVNERDMMFSNLVKFMFLRMSIGYERTDVVEVMNRNALSVDGYLQVVSMGSTFSQNFFSSFTDQGLVLKQLADGVIREIDTDDMDKLMVLGEAFQKVFSSEVLQPYEVYRFLYEELPDPVKYSDGEMGKFMKESFEDGNKQIQELFRTAIETFVDRSMTKEQLAGEIKKSVDRFREQFFGKDKPESSNVTEEKLDPKNFKKTPPQKRAPFEPGEEQRSR